jgi:DNA-binding FrmR family transcriptional regulator
MLMRSGCYCRPECQQDQQARYPLRDRTHSATPRTDVLTYIKTVNKMQIPYLVWYRPSEYQTMSHTVKDKQKLLLRAKRIQGQVEALVRALAEERDCSEVLQVMSAARGAMNSLMAELLEGHIRSHVLIGKQRPSSGQLAAADEVIDMVKSYLK